MPRPLPILLALLALANAPAPLRADEGMWTFDNLPLKQLKEKYGFVPDQAWLDHVRLSAIHFGGASGSFVSPDGLVLTNHHVGRGAVQRLSSKEKDYIKNGFLAATREEELKVPNLTLRTLMAMENVTERVRKAVKAGATEKDAAKQRLAELDAAKAEVEKKTGLSCDAVTLYQGGEYWIYGYKRHTDVRLVAAPEMGIAFFGGDPDNFTYPRHNLDVCLFRVYEDGKPYRPPHFLNWAEGGLKAGDLTFVVGHPGRTARLQTYAQMLYERDTAIPNGLKSSGRLRDVLMEYSARGAEQARQVTTLIFGVENGLKANKGALDGLKDVEAMKAIEKAEKELRARVAADPKLTASTGQSWAKIQGALDKQKAFAKEAMFVGSARSTTLGQALGLVRLADQVALPEAARLSEYRSEASLKSLRTRLSGPSTGMMGMAFNPDQETLMFTRGLEDALKELGPDHAFVKTVLGGKTPAEVAKSAVEGTKLGDAAVRKALVEGGKKAIAESADPMIVLARKIEPEALKLRKKQDDVAAVISEHASRIANARFAVYGKSRYPDATSSLRLSFGPVASYPANGTLIQPFTTFHGLFDRYEGWGGNAARAENGAWTLPQRWLDRKSKLNLDTPFNFVHAVDIIGGNSGSPVVNVRGELVGLIFDGNIESNAGRYFYDARVNRGVSVDARAILESLEKVMDAGHLVKEIRGK
ncbi:MAG: S46 family peptidase [Acidobacteria bacterium]|nr:S46 family peptidase [Acidobacteriota bacterium]